PRPPRRPPAPRGARAGGARPRPARPGPQPLLSAGTSAGARDGKPAAGPDAPTVSPEEVTVATPIVRTTKPEAETSVLPRIEERAADETAVLRPVRDADETAVLPSVRDTPPSDPVDRVPQGIFRDAGPARQQPQGANDRTRELPQLDENGRPRRRSDWAEETPLDDLPTLADELFGPHDDEDEGPRRRR
ncbi:dTMP kinase, partial [Streptomyces sp. NPDC059556]